VYYFPPPAGLDRRPVRMFVNVTNALVASHSVDVAVERAVAWACWTDVSNWEDPPATFSLEGPFAAGSRGRTIIPGTPPIEWTILDAGNGHATIEIALERAAIRFDWTFEVLDRSHTRLTQRVSLSGPNSGSYLDEARSVFGSTMAGGMTRLADSMVRKSRANSPLDPREKDPR
jgi:hypothetical protein